VVTTQAVALYTAAYDGAPNISAAASGDYDRYRTLPSQSELVATSTSGLNRILGPSANVGLVCTALTGSTVLKKYNSSISISAISTAAQPSILGEDWVVQPAGNERWGVQ